MSNLNPSSYLSAANLHNHNNHNHFHIPNDILQYNLWPSLSRSDIISLANSSKSIYQLVTSIPLGKLCIRSCEYFKYIARMNRVGLNHWTFSTISLYSDEIAKGLTPEELSIIHGVFGLREEQLEDFSKLFAKNKNKLRSICYYDSTLHLLLKTLRNMEMMDIEEFSFHGTDQNSLINTSLREWTKLKKVFFFKEHGPLPVDFFPSSVKKICMNYAFTEPIRKGFIPEGLEKLHLGSKFNDPLDSSLLPPSITELFLHYYHHPLQLRDTSILHLSISGGKFDRTVRNQLPSSLISLEWNCVMFVNALEPGDLPASLQKIYISTDYHPLSLPVGLFIGLKEANINMIMRSPLTPGVFPPSLRTVKLSKYNLPIALGVFPEGLEDIEFGVYFDHPFIPGVLPSSLKRLKVGLFFHQTLNHENIPGSLKVLEMSPSWKLESDLSKTNISRLEFSAFYGRDISTKDFLVNSRLPQGLSTIVLPPLFIGEVTISLPTLTSLSFASDYNRMFDLRNTSIKSLSLPKDFDIPLEEVIPFLPPTLEVLNIPYSQRPNYRPDTNIINMILKSIISLKLGSFVMSL